MGNIMRVPKLAETIAERWRGLKKFAADLAAQLPGLGPRGNQGIKQNLAILEAWIRAALLALAEQVELPARRKMRRKAEAVAKPTERASSERRLGFRAIEPDEYEKQRLSEKAAKTRFDISQFSGGGPRSAHDPRPAYRRRLAAIEAVLDGPEVYARRVKQRLEARAKRPPVKHVTVTHRSALPDLLQVSRHSDLGRYVWYNDSS